MAFAAMRRPSPRPAQLGPVCPGGCLPTPSLHPKVHNPSPCIVAHAMQTRAGTASTCKSRHSTSIREKNRYPRCMAGPIGGWYRSRCLHSPRDDNARISCCLRPGVGELFSVMAAMRRGCVRRTPSPEDRFIRRPSYSIIRLALSRWQSAMPLPSWIRCSLAQKFALRM